MAFTSWPQRYGLPCFNTSENCMLSRAASVASVLISQQRERMMQAEGGGDNRSSAAQRQIYNLENLAGGTVGKYIAEALIKNGKHTVTAITRTDSTTKLPDGVHVKKVNYDDLSTIVDALRGQDAFIITMGVMAPKDTQRKLIQAAAEANVPWVLPNEWAPDTANELLGVEAMIGPPTKAARDYITELGKSSWIAVSTGFWYEWSVSIPYAYGFNISKREAILYDEGETKINTSTWPQVGRAVAALLSLPVHADAGAPSLEQFKNGFAYVSSFTVSQKDMLESLLRVTQTKIEDWKVTKEPAQERYAKGMAEMKAGDFEGFGKALYARVFYPDGSGNVADSKGLSDDLLGLPKEDIDEATKEAVQRHEATGGRGYY
ncbi:hypothetical protein FH972_023595 [Carpinus fangiana]|uniref:NAD(P)-binding domain-containing protein n=1 Tax=Carpinus fangiana TaxID=176857 RepID=A0A5N6KVM5_9ROSI|nr:hypothetical protein FH972_023595 [Carpinus fangiana]